MLQHIFPLYQNWSCATSAQKCWFYGGDRWPNVFLHLL